MCLMAQVGRKSIGDKIKRYRIKQGLTQEKLAEILDISIAHLSYIENSKRLPSLKMLRRLALALKVSLKDLV
ncbi:hypothetical protein A3F62_04840 [Candidatus Woesebacteria bacterium RIFCSPHIGHO2_12_FULL_44_11]|nr:MAG: hypothetical protein A3F62_04840 [Candidatus Woesebacteria bacterium RIFCSPHIGHO2_12_FULL_44_11]